VPGRMECIQRAPFLAVVDYAHTPHALRMALATLRTKAQGRVIAVFGSMGGRERPRRAGLGQAAAHSADYVVLTTDDPGNEDPLAIIREIAAALQHEGRREERDYKVIPDRREAIRWALAQARPGDAVLIAGMGAEPSMLVGNGTVPWDDREATRQALQELAVRRQ
jgi:UDP-N-acetylmuramoyl-L-alanyl-D-glutamate--2,6-diaminopimelate ligase